MESFNLSEGAAEQIQKGRVYLGPRDVNGYPTLMLCQTPDLQTNTETCDKMIEALKFVVCVMKKYQMLPYYCEQFNLFIDLRGKGLFGTPLALPRRFVDFINKQFKNEINKFIIYDVSSTAYFQIKMVMKLFSTPRINKACIIKGGDFPEQHKYFDQKNLQIRYGGNIPNLNIGQFWPPQDLHTDQVIKLV